MSKLGQLLSYLDRPEVTELSFRSGAPAMMQVGNRQHPITVTPLRMAQLRRFFVGTPVMALFPSGGKRSLQTHHLSLQGRPYRVTIRGNSSAVEIRVSIDESADDKEATVRSPPVVLGRRSDSDRPVPSGKAPARPRNPTPAGGVALPDGDRLGPARSRGEASRAYPMRSRSPDLAIDRSPSASPAPARALEIEIERNDDLGASHHGGHQGLPLDRPSPSTGKPTVRDFPAEDEDDDLRVRRPTPRSDDRRNDPPPRTPTVSNATAMPSLTRSADAASSSASAPSPATPTARAAPGVPVPVPSPAPSEPLRVSEPSRPIRVSGDPSPPIRVSEPGTPLRRSEPEPEPESIAALSGPHVEARAGAPVHAGLRQLLASARHQGASDIHIMASEPVRLRRAGDLAPTGNVIPPHQVKAMIEPLLEPRHAEQLATLGYADLGVEIAGAGRLRLNVNRQRTGLKICIRLVVNEPPTIEQLGLPDEVNKLVTHHQGMVLISGPNGHGKTTTMAAMVDMFNANKALHIITVEDPVEVLHPPKKALITQREIGTHTRSFTTALAAALREDPDVIAIGELRDRETVEMALSAAETGHLVLATMSTPSGAKTIDRVIDMFPPDDQSQVRATLSGALKLVISQRLLRRADGTGMVAAYEMITGNVPLWTLIRDNKLYQLPSLLQRGRNYGMIRLEDSLREQISQGVVTEQEALLYAEDPRALAPPAKIEPPPSSSSSGWRFGRGR